MRIIGGDLKGLRLHPPTNLPVRPTTDMAKEALFNILYNRFDFENIRVLDLFSGTGSISLEFASRGVPEVVSVDKDYGCYNFLKSVLAKYELTGVHAYRADVFKFIKQETKPYDLIFSDPPYDHPQLPNLPNLIFEQKLFAEDGVLIMEHHSLKKLDQHPNFKEKRKYGSSTFSFFSG